MSVNILGRFAEKKSLVGKSLNIGSLVLKKKHCFSAWVSTLNMGLINKG